MKMNESDYEIALALENVNFGMATWAKRFARDMVIFAKNSKDTAELTPQQSEWLYRILFSYRHQLPNLYNKYKDHPHCCNKNAPNHKN